MIVVSNISKDIYECFARIVDDLEQKTHYPSDSLMAISKALRINPHNMRYKLAAEKANELARIEPSADTKQNEEAANFLIEKTAEHINNLISGLRRGKLGTTVKEIEDYISDEESTSYVLENNSAYILMTTCIGIARGFDGMKYNLKAMELTTRLVKFTAITKQSCDAWAKHIKETPIDHEAIKAIPLPEITAQDVQDYDKFMKLRGQQPSVLYNDINIIIEQLVKHCCSAVHLHNAAIEVLENQVCNSGDPERRLKAAKCLLQYAPSHNKEDQKEEVGKPLSGRNRKKNTDTNPKQPIGNRTEVKLDQKAEPT